MEQLLELYSRRITDPAHVLVGYAADNFGLDLNEHPFEFSARACRLDVRLLPRDSELRMKIVAYLAGICDWNEARNYPYNSMILLAEIMLVLGEEVTHRPESTETRVMLMSILALPNVFKSAAEGDGYDAIDELFAGPHFSIRDFSRHVLPILPLDVLYAHRETSVEHTFEAEGAHKKQLWSRFFTFLYFFQQHVLDNEPILWYTIPLIEAFMERAPAGDFFARSMQTEGGTQIMLHVLFRRTLFEKRFSEIGDFSVRELAEQVFRNTKFYDDIVSVANEKSAHFCEWNADPDRGRTKPQWHLLTLREIMERSRFPWLVDYLPQAATKSACY